MRKFSVLVFQVFIFSMSSFAQSTAVNIGGKWEGSETAVCFHRNTGAWSTKENSTKVTFTPDEGSNGQYGTFTAMPAFFGLPNRTASSTDRCTATPTGVSTGRYFVSGQKIAFGHCETANSCSFSWDYSFSLVSGKMAVSSGSFSYSLSKSGAGY